MIATKVELPSGIDRLKFSEGHISGTRELGAMFKRPSRKGQGR